MIYIGNSFKGKKFFFKIKKNRIIIYKDVDLKKCILTKSCSFRFSACTVCNNAFDAENTDSHEFVNR